MFEIAQLVGERVHHGPGSVSHPFQSSAAGRRILRVKRPNSMASVHSESHTPPHHPTLWTHRPVQAGLKPDPAETAAGGRSYVLHSPRIFQFKQQSVKIPIPHQRAQTITPGTTHFTERDGI